MWLSTYAQVQWNLCSSLCEHAFWSDEGLDYIVGELALNYSAARNLDVVLILGFWGLKIASLAYANEAYHVYDIVGLFCCLFP